MKTTQIHSVPKKVTPARLQEYGVGVFSAIPTKSALKKALKKRCITVNNTIAGTATVITGGETIKLSLPKDKPPAKELNLTLRVLYEDDHLALVAKPAGVVVSGNSFKTVANALPQNLTPSGFEDATSPQPVHRLDLATTGVLLTGKTLSAIRALNKLFEDKQVEKIYYAVCIGKMKSSGTITAAIDGKPSRTHYLVLDSVPSERFGSLNLVELRPRTGRRHQLRKHLSALGNPILGDREYGLEDFILKGKGLYLHAGRLKFQHPFSGETIHVQHELPKKFRKIFPAKE